MSYDYELARERTAELIREADRQRLVKTARRARKERRTDRAGGSRPSSAWPTRAGGASSAELAA
jgi:hypothetical protein